MGNAAQSREELAAEIDELCENEKWAKENDSTVEWARGMWYCPCPKCNPV